MANFQPRDVMFFSISCCFFVSLHLLVYRGFVPKNTMLGFVIFWGIESHENHGFLFEID